jgi:hypothetical protein
MQIATERPNKKLFQIIGNATTWKDTEDLFEKVLQDYPGFAKLSVKYRCRHDADFDKNNPDALPNIIMELDRFKCHNFKDGVQISVVRDLFPNPDDQDLIMGILSLVQYVMVKKYGLRMMNVRGIIVFKTFDIQVKYATDPNAVHGNKSFRFPDRSDKEIDNLYTAYLEFMYNHCTDCQRGEETVCKIELPEDVRYKPVIVPEFVDIPLDLGASDDVPTDENVLEDVKPIYFDQKIFDEIHLESLKELYLQKPNFPKKKPTQFYSYYVVREILMRTNGTLPTVRTQIRQWLYRWFDVSYGVANDWIKYLVHSSRFDMTTGKLDIDYSSLESVYEAHSNLRREYEKGRAERRALRNQSRNNTSSDLDTDDTTNLEFDTVEEMEEPLETDQQTIDLSLDEAGDEVAISQVVGLISRNKKLRQRVIELENLLRTESQNYNTMKQEIAELKTQISILNEENLNLRKLKDNMKSLLQNG